jgi:hypothetical protein
MAKLTAKARSKIPTSQFAGPNRTFPIQDRAHAANAKARASQFASPALKAKIFAKANKVLGKGKEAPGKKEPGSRFDRMSKESQSSKFTPKARG